MIKIFHSMVQNICKNKAMKINNEISKFLSGKLLDVGAGRCYISKEIQSKNKGVDTTCIDITDFNKTDLKLILYDGKNIPFKDNSFDNILLIYVLHHVDDPTAMLKECIR